MALVAEEKISRARRAAPRRTRFTRRSRGEGGVGAFGF